MDAYIPKCFLYFCQIWAYAAPCCTRIYQNARLWKSFFERWIIPEAKQWYRNNEFLPFLSVSVRSVRPCPWLNAGYLIFFLLKTMLHWVGRSNFRDLHNVQPTNHNKWSDRSMGCGTLRKLAQTIQPTDRRTDRRAYRKVSLPKNIKDETCRAYFVHTFYLWFKLKNDLFSKFNLWFSF